MASRPVLHRSCLAAALLACCHFAQAEDVPPVPNETIVVSENPLRELPLPARNPLDLVRTWSEITPGQQGGDLEGFGPYGFRGNSGLNAFGHRSQSNSFLLDGFDNNDPWIRGPLLAAPLNSIFELAPLSGYISPEYGRAAGLVLNVTTRSGSNALHGSIFGFRQTSAMAARNYFDGADKPGLSHTETGVSAGGALRRDKWYWFLETQTRSDNSGQTVISTVPSTTQKLGQFPSGVIIYDPATIFQTGPELYQRVPFPGNSIPAQRISPAARNLFSLYPEQNRLGNPGRVAMIRSGNFSSTPDPNPPVIANNYGFTGTRTGDTNSLLLRSDYTISPASRLFVRLNYETGKDRAPGAFASSAGFAGSDAAQNATAVNTDGTWLGGALSFSRTFHQNFVYEARFGVTSGSLHARTPGSAAIPNYVLSGYASLGAATAAPFDVRTVNYDIETSLSLRTGRHMLRAGLQLFRRRANGNASEWNPRGTYFFKPDYTGQPGIPYTGDSFATFMLGYPSEIRRDVQGSDYHLRGSEFAGYVQDSFSLGRLLTIEAGVRYSLLPPLAEANDRMVNFNFNSSPALSWFAGQGGVDRYAGVGYKKGTIAPRIGFAFDAFGNGSTVVRGSFSQAYDTGAYLTMGRLARNAPYASRLDAIYGTFQLGARLDDGLPAPVFAPLSPSTVASGGAGTAIYAVEPAGYTPYSDQWSLSLAMRLSREISLELGGMGSMGMHLYSAYDFNQPYPAPTPYSWPRYPYEPYHGRIDYLGFGGGSTYYGGVAKLRGRWRSVDFLLSYTHGKALDDASEPSSDQASRPAAPQYVYHLRGARSVSSFDVAQRLVWTASYDIPVRGGIRSGIAAGILSNWRIQAVTTAETGLPFTPELAINSLNNGGIQLPNRVGDGSLASGARTAQLWFNSSLAGAGHAFEVPALYQYGNSGFNILRGPGLFTIDGSLGRAFTLRGDLRLRARAEVYNLANRTNLALPNRVLGTAPAGSISHTATRARAFQLAASLDW